MKDQQKISHIEPGVNIPRRDARIVTYAIDRALELTKKEHKGIGTRAEIADMERIRDDIRRKLGD